MSNSVSAPLQLNMTWDNNLNFLMIIFISFIYFYFVFRSDFTDWVEGAAETVKEGVEDAVDEIKEAVNCRKRGEWCMGVPRCCGELRCIYEAEGVDMKVNTHFLFFIFSYRKD